jgi:cysteine desulfurase family protein
VRIYLDNAATSWPKPEPVYQAVDRYQREVGAAAGRAGYRDAQKAQQVVDVARRAAARLFAAPDLAQIVWASNGTDALNLALHGLLGPADHVVTTVCEHNSVLRPLATLARDLDVQVSYVGCDASGSVDPDQIAQAINDRTRLVVVSHASNVTGTIQPIAEIAAHTQPRGIPLLVDAAQTAGLVPIDVIAMGIDLLAASGHKGLLGPLGTGLLYVGDAAKDRLRPVRQGGTGSLSEQPFQPDHYPDRLESGNLNVAGLAGLAAALDWLASPAGELGVQQEMAATERLFEQLQGVPGVSVYGPPPGAPRASVVSLAIDGYEPQEIAGILDASAEVQCRAGLHCAPRMHQALGTASQGGLVRLSPGWSTTPAEIDIAVELIRSLASSA